MNQSLTRGTRFLFSALCLFLFGFVIRPAAAQGDDAAGVNLEIKAGFDGYYKSSYWVPVQIRVSNKGPAIEGELRMTTGSAAAGDQITYKSAITLPTQSEKTIMMTVRMSSFSRELRVDLLDKQNLVASALSNRLTELSDEDLLYGVISSNPGEFTGLEDVAGSRSEAAVAFLSLDEMPDVSAAWNALDILIFNDVDSSRITTGQIDALTAWLSVGGQVVITGGANWQKTAVGLSDLIPVAISGTESLEDLPALRQHTGEPFRDSGPYLVTTSSLQQGELIIHQDGLPLLARQNWGAGFVYFLALDPQLAPMKDWDGSAQVWAEIAQVVPDLPTWATGIQNSYAAATAVSSLPSLALPSVLQLAIFLFIYVLVVGPVNYLVLKRTNRREFAWLSIPALVILFSGIAYFTGFQLKGNKTILNQMSVAFGQVGGEKMRVQSLIGLYSPRRATYDLVFPADSAARPFNRNSGSGRLSGGGNIRAISRSSNLTIQGIRVDVSGTETFIADSYRPAPKVNGQAFLNIADSAVQLDYTLQNNDRISLENSVLLIGNRAVEIGTLEPGAIKTGSTIVSSLSASGSSGFSPGFAPPPGGPAPLQSNADLILGTSNYYEDSEAFPRWQLLQAVEGDPVRGGPGSTFVPTVGDTITLIAWSDETQLSLSLNKGGYDTEGVTLYFLELPLIQNLVSGDEIEIPLFLLNWYIEEANNVYDPSVENLYLPNGWVDIHYEPWPDFQTMQVDNLSLILAPENDPAFQSAPLIRLWNWQKERWETLAGATWGSTAVPDPDPYLGPGRAVLIRLQNTGQVGIEIQTVYPVYAGSLQ